MNYPIYLGQGFYKNQYGMVYRKTKPRKKTAKEIAEINALVEASKRRRREAGEQWQREYEQGLVEEPSSSQSV